MNRILEVTRMFVVLTALLALLAGTASASGGINLSWNDCGTAGVLQRNFACSSNTLTGATMIASAIAGVDMPQLVGAETVMVLQVNQAALSPWWELYAGGCRASGLLVNADFASSGPFTCADAWSGQAIAYLEAEPWGAARERIRTVEVLVNATSIDASSEYYVFSLRLLGLKTTGSGSCAGCTDGACIVLDQIQFEQQNGLASVTLNNPITRQYVLWQDGGSGVIGGCPAATPASNRTWGSVKSLYR